MLGATGRKRLGLGVVGATIAAAVAVPTWVAASGQSGVSVDRGHVAQEAGEPEFTFDFWEFDGPALGFAPMAGAVELIEVDDGRGFARGPRFVHLGGFGITQEVMEQFGVDDEELRAALETVREQFPPEDRPEITRPLSDEDREALDAYRAEQVAALAAALGIPADEFQAAIDAALEDRRAEFEAHRAELEERKNAWYAALADALGVTVEELQATIEEAREAVGGDVAGPAFGGMAVPAFEVAGSIY